MAFLMLRDEVNSRHCTFPFYYALVLLEHLNLEVAEEPALHRNFSGVAKGKVAEKEEVVTVVLG